MTPLTEAAEASPGTALDDAPAVEGRAVSRLADRMSGDIVAERLERRFGLASRISLTVFTLVAVGIVLSCMTNLAERRRAWIEDRIASARIAALAITATPDLAASEDRMSGLLDALGARSIVVEAGSERRRFGPALSIEGSGRIDLAGEGPVASLLAASRAVLVQGSRSVWLVGGPVARKGGVAPFDRVDVLVGEADLQAALRNALAVPLLVGLAAAVLAGGGVHLIVRRGVVRPVRRLEAHLSAFAGDPDGIERTFVPSGAGDEIGEAERALARMQRSLSAEWRERRRLAGLGLAVSKINHELRNFLTTAQLLSDRLDGVADPVVQRVSPRLMTILDRAIRFCEATLAYGRATEPASQRRPVRLAPLIEEMEDIVRLSPPGHVRIETRFAPDLCVDVDPEQFSRALTNIVRNAVEALDTMGAAQPSPVVTVTAYREAGRIVILLADNGPGLPDSARATLFTPFQGSTRAGGSGLGLAIALELVRLNGGSLDLDESDAGACFRIVVPEGAEPRGN